MTRPDLAALPVSMLDEPPDELLAWARTALADAGYRVSAGAPVLRRREWSTVARLDTDRGPVWVKGNARDFGVEAALVDVLAGSAADHVVTPIAIDPVRCRMVTPDGGRTLRESGGAAEADWTILLTGYAALQKQVAPRLPALRAIGLPDLTPPTLTGWHRAVLDRVHAEPALSVLLTGADLTALADLLPATAALAAELGSDGLPMTVEHNDLHRGNVFAAGPGYGLRIFDWGDAALAHPFHSLGRTVTVAAGDAGAVSPSAGHLREAMLRVWSGGADVPDGWRRSATVAGVLSQLTTAASHLRMAVAATPARSRAFVDLLTGYARDVPALSAA